MDHIVIAGVPPYDGRYEYDMVERPFTIREWGWIKKYSGHLPVTFIDGWRNGDAELLATFAIIALVRVGKVGRDEVGQVWERFGDAPGITTVQLEFEDTDDEEDEQLPPPLEPSSGSSNGFSGDGSRTSSDPSDLTRPVTGTPASATSVFLPET